MGVEDRIGTQTVDQLMLREQAVADNPDFATIEGRVFEDMRATIAYLAVGIRPDTVLYGLMFSQYGLFDSTFLPGNDRGAIQIGVAANIDPVGLNKRGDRVVDILEGYVSLGFVERVYDPNSIDAALLPDDDHHRLMDYPTYKLSGVNLPPKVAARIESIAGIQSEIDERSEKIAARKAQPRKRLLRRRQ